MTVTEAPIHDVVATVVSLPIELVVPDPANPRVKLREIKQLTASITARIARGDSGLLEPIHVRLLDSEAVPDLTGRYMVVRGHRRLAGCQAAELTHVDAIVVSAEQAERIRASDRLVENLQRDDFTATEQARAVQQMLDLGMTAAEVAGDTALPVEAVLQASAVAGSKGVALVTAKFDITMDQAAALVEFEDDKEAFKTLTTTAVESPSRFDQRVAQYRSLRAEDEREKAAAKEWADKGYATLTWQDTSKGSTVALWALKSTGKGKAKVMSAAQHKGCPHRAVVVRAYGTRLEVDHYCTDPVKAGHEQLFTRGSDGTMQGNSGTKSAAQIEKEKTQRRQHLAGMAASRLAQVTRREFVANLLKRRGGPKGLVQFVVAQLVEEHSGMESRHAPMFAQLVGAGDTGSEYGRHNVVQRDYLAKCAGRELSVLLARICSEREYKWDPNTWNAKDDAQRPAYLAFLVANGYEPSTVERIATLDATASDVLAEADRMKARGRPAKTTGAKTAAGHRTAVKRAPVRRVAKKRAPVGNAAKRRAPAKPARKRLPVKKATKRRTPFAERAAQGRAQ